MRPATLYILVAALSMLVAVKVALSPVISVSDPAAAIQQNLSSP